MILINPEGDTAFESEKFHHAYVWNSDLSNSVCLNIKLDDGQEVWWDSSPLVCEPAKQDMIKSLKELVSKLDKVWICDEGLDAFNISYFSHARIKDAKEVFMYFIAIFLDDGTELWWDGVPMDGSEDELQPVLANLVNKLNKENKQ